MLRGKHKILCTAIRCALAAEVGPCAPDITLEEEISAMAWDMLKRTNWSVGAAVAMLQIVNLSRDLNRVRDN